MWRTKINIFGKTAFGIWLLAVGFVTPVYAQSTDGVLFSSFASVMDVRADGSVEITETFYGEFETPHHGLFRSIPVRYEIPETRETRSVRLKVLEATYQGTPEPFSVSRVGDELEINVGRADVLIDGPFVYTLRYRVERALLFFEKEAELYWVVTDPRESAAFPSTTALVRVEGVQSDNLRAVCFTGGVGSTEKNCVTRVEDNGIRFSANDHLTVAVRFPKSAVREPMRVERLFFFLPILSFFIVFILWWKKGRDPKGRGTVVAQYEPPDRLSPMQLGVLWKEASHGHDFAAVLVDLAVRGYLKIKEEGKGKYRFIQGKSAESSMLGAEQDILKALFRAKSDVTLDERGEALGVAREKAEEDTYKEMEREGYFAEHPKNVRNRFYGIGILMIFFSFFILSSSGDGVWGIPLGVGLLVSSLPVFGFGTFMPRRTKKGALVREHAAGFKLFLSTAERYRLKWQEKEGIFEQYLPYAMVFEIVEKWTKAFEGIAVRPPDWYEGAQPFSAVMFGRQMALFSVLTANAAHPPESKGGHSVSSGGGFGGGGFSGGGFGGGRTGGW